MSLKLRILLLISILTLLFFTSCGPKGQKEPTVGPDAIYTSAAETVRVQLTQNAVQHQITTATQEIISQPSATPTQMGPQNPTSTSASLATQTNTPQSVLDKADLIQQNITDGSAVPINNAFEMIWEVKNIGPTTWNTNYQVRFYSGNRLGVGLPQSYPFTAVVAPNETYQVVVQMETGSETGEFTSSWVLTNDEGVNFYPLWITVSLFAPTPTSTPTHTPSATITDTPTPTATQE